MASHRNFSLKRVQLGSPMSRKQFLIVFANVVVMAVTTHWLHRHLGPLPSPPWRRLPHGLTQSPDLLLRRFSVVAAVVVVATAAVLVLVSFLFLFSFLSLLLWFLFFLLFLFVLKCAAIDAAVGGWHRLSSERRPDEAKQRGRDGNALRAVRGSGVPLPAGHGARTIQRE